MRTFWKAVQAVTVELVGVLLVVWMLFGFTALGLHSVSGQPPRLPLELSERFAAWKGNLVAAAVPDRLPDVQRERYVAERLNFYSQTYAEVAKQHLGVVVGR